MKLSHLAIVFAIIAFTVILITDIKTNNLKAVIDNKEQINRNLDTAIDDGVSKLVLVDDNNNLDINKQGAMDSFFMSLSSSFGVLSDKKSFEKLELYIPVVTVTEEDGYYIYYSDEFTGTDGYSYVSKRWSEKFPYYYEDTDFIYGFTLGDIVNLYDKNNLLNGGSDLKAYSMDYHEFQTDSFYAAFRASRPNSILLNNEAFELARKGAIINCLESTMAYYTSRHNKIASDYGITYNFSLPARSLDDWAAAIDDVSMFVVFQGYPYGNGLGETYNRLASAAAKVSKSEVYYIEQKGWYLVYHKASCTELQKVGIILREEPYYDSIDCVKQGCYQCPICFPNGIYAPEYVP